jgi:NitT/TauT family transport system ATP-binding protein
MSKALVTLENVSKTYPNGTIAVEDVNLTIKAGEFISLLGPSGRVNAS